MPIVALLLSVFAFTACAGAPPSKPAPPPTNQVVTPSEPSVLLFPLDVGPTHVEAMGDRYVLEVDKGVLDGIGTDVSAKVLANDTEYDANIIRVNNKSTLLQLATAAPRLDPSTTIVRFFPSPDVALVAPVIRRETRAGTDQLTIRRGTDHRIDRRWRVTVLVNRGEFHEATFLTIDKLTSVIELTTPIGDAPIIAVMLRPPETSEPVAPTSAP
jgi:hypothetical protein